MNTRHLETFVAVADSGSFSKAAQRLYTTATALTQQVNALERDLGFELLARTHRGCDLTAAGAIYYKYAKEILSLAKTAREHAETVAGVRKHVVRIANYRNVAMVLMQPLLSDFARLHPGVEVEFVDGDYREFFDALVNGSVDLLIHPYGAELDRPDVGFQKIGTSRPCLSMSYDHPLAARSTLALEDLAGCDVIVGCGCGSRSLDDLKRRLAQGEPGIHVQSFATESEVWNHVLRQGWLLLTMDYAARYVGSCVSVPLDWHEEFDYGFVYRIPHSVGIERLLCFAAAGLGQFPHRAHRCP